jgi:esterase/lipase superfamily enzyme
MGNRAVCDALKAFSYDPSNSVKFDHLVLAAPDIDAEIFQELAILLQRLSARILCMNRRRIKRFSHRKRFMRMLVPGNLC